MKSHRNFYEWAEEMNQTVFDSESRLEMYKELFLNKRIFEDSFPDYLLKVNGFNQQRPEKMAINTRFNIMTDYCKTKVFCG